MTVSMPSLGKDLAGEVAGRAAVDVVTLTKVNVADHQAVVGDVIDECHPDEVYDFPFGW